MDEARSGQRAGRKLGRWARVLGVGLLVVALAAAGGYFFWPRAVGNPHLRVAGVPSLHDTGILPALARDFAVRNGIAAKVVGRKAGSVADLGRRGLADVILTNDPTTDEALSARGLVVGRATVMSDDFIIVGPLADPAGAKEATTVGEALRRIADAGALFVGRFDDPGIAARERLLWRLAALPPRSDPTGPTPPTWYVPAKRTGEGLALASQKGAYTLADRSSFLVHQKDLNLVGVAQGGGEMENVYSALAIGGGKAGTAPTMAQAAQAFVAYLVSPAGQQLIANYGADRYPRSLYAPAAPRQASRFGE